MRAACCAPPVRNVCARWRPPARPAPAGGAAGVRTPLARVRAPVHNVCARGATTYATNSRRWDSSCAHHRARRACTTMRDVRARLPASMRKVRRVVRAGCARQARNARRDVRTGCTHNPALPAARRRALEENVRIQELMRERHVLVTVTHEKSAARVSYASAAATPMETLLKRFQSFKPPTLTGTESAIECENWLEDIEKLFEALDYTDERRVKLSGLVARVVISRCVSVFALRIKTTAFRLVGATSFGGCVWYQLVDFVCVSAGCSADVDVNAGQRSRSSKMMRRRFVVVTGSPAAIATLRFEVATGTSREKRCVVVFLRLDTQLLEEEASGEQPRVVPRRWISSRKSEHQLIVLF
ncbi:hypothetical protein F511_40707 [Dorcoceras hygrometricum]|uniref:Uncharacterized protein n=1 Tax=Dorcoceras hygrometricum TaxID=472368 RepID=A0A2Z7AQK5_9LAMI|nr:hypothetical protein F511_40707 [Dorcoceras hygrometricum]